MEVRELLDSYDFPGDDIPVVRGSALVAVEDGDEELGKNAILELMEEVDSFIETPKRDLDKDFLLPVEDVFSIAGRGTVATGRVEQGVVTVGDDVEIKGGKKEHETAVTGVEMFKKMLDQGQAGDNVGVLLRGVKRDEIQRGQVICAPGSQTCHKKFEAEVYVLKKEEGGRHTPFFSNYSPQFFFRTSDVTGGVELPKDVKMVMPGDNATFGINLIQPTPMHEGLRFAVREGGRTVAAGVVSKIIE